MEISFYIWNIFIYKFLVVIITFKIFSTVLKRSVRITFNGFENTKVNTSDITSGHEHCNKKRPAFFLVSLFPCSHAPLLSFCCLVYAIEISIESKCLFCSRDAVACSISCGFPLALLMVRLSLLQTYKSRILRRQW